MGDMLIRGVPDAVKTRLTEIAKQRGESVAQAAIDMIRRGIAAEDAAKAKPARNAWADLRSAFEEAGAVDGEFARIMDDIEAERKKDFGRPLDFGLHEDEAG